MKTINLKCGHKLRVKEWPSQAGLKKVREHYKKYHPKIMKDITKKSIATKKKEGLIKKNPGEYTHILSKTPAGWDYQVFRGSKKIASGTEKTKSAAAVKVANTIVKKNPKKKKITLSVPQKHQLKIARSTLKMSDAGARVTGGPTKAEARQIIKKLTGKIPVKNPKSKKSKYAYRSIVLYKDITDKKTILFGIVQSIEKDRNKGITKYLVQWYSISKKLEQVSETENDLNQLPVIFVTKNQENLIKFMPQIIKGFMMLSKNKQEFIKRLQDIVGLTKTQANKVWSKLKEV